LTILTFLEILVVIIILIGAGMMAKSYFRTDKEQQELWAKSADAHNSQLDAALKAKDINTYRAMLDADVTRFMPKLPYRADGPKLVGELIADQLASADGPPTASYSKKIQSYQNCVVITYTFVLRGKQGDKGNKEDKDEKGEKVDKTFEFTGKTTRVWARTGNRWVLAHEHVSFNS
jgi:ketosteroid isomerase-like protein